METIHVNVKDAYDVLVGPGLLSQSGALIKDIDSRIQKLLIVSDSNVARLYKDALADVLRGADFEVFDFVFDAGEQSKNLETVGAILGVLAEKAFTRTDAVIALGGGPLEPVFGRFPDGREMHRGHHRVLIVN